MNWVEFRDEMPICRRWAYFDHAAVAPLSGPASDALCRYARDMSQNGDVSESFWMGEIRRVRELAGQLLNSDPGNVAFIKNTSEGICFVAEGLDWRPGDNVVIAAEEYPSNVYPWLNLTPRGVEVRMVPSRGACIEIDDIRDRIDARTRIVSLSMVEFASGFRNDLDAVGELCRSRGVFFMVDAIQGLGVFSLDVSRTPIDFLAADGHKWLLGPEGAGLFYIRPELVERLHPISVGWHSVVKATDFSTIDFRLKPNAGRWESGSLNVGGIVALGASLELLLAAGIEQVGRRVLELTDYLCERLRHAGQQVFSSRRTMDRSGIVSFVSSGGDPVELVKKARDAGIVINCRAGRVRLSPHCYNTQEEIDRFIQLL